MSKYQQIILGPGTMVWANLGLMTLGKYWNGAYFIGKIVEFNAWNRTLTEDEHLKYLSYETYVEAKKKSHEFPRKMDLQQ